VQAGTGGLGVSCLRGLPLVVLLGAGVVVGMPAAMPEVHAQDYAQDHAQAGTDDYLMRPLIDGDPANPPRFRRPQGARTTAATPSRQFGFEPGFGASTTGFDSTNIRKKKAKAVPKIKRPETANTFGAPPVRSTANLPIAAALLPRNQVRRGASPYAIVPDPSTEPTDSPLRHRQLKQDETPFDPVGIQAGPFVFKPAIELSGGYDTNPARTLTGTASWFYLISPELLFNSNWQRHEFKGELRGSYVAYPQLPSENRPDFNGKLSGRIDVTRDTRLELEGRFIVGTDNPGSPNIQTGLARLPIYTTWGGTAGLGHRFNRFEILAKVAAERTVYQDSTFTDGTTASNADRNYNLYGTTLRGSYEVTPGLKPFVEVGADQRVHDLEFDVSGLQRDSDGWFAKAGSSFEFSRILTGEIATGWLIRHYKDPSLPDISGPTIDGSLVWLASGLTTVKLTAKTFVAESTSFGTSGIFSREVALQVAHAFRRWLVATLTLTRGFDDYVGSPRRDDRYAASGVIAYKLTRELQLKSEVRREWRRSNTSGNDYTADIVLFGLRLQR
jgi:hypothetical protein